MLFRHLIVTMSAASEHSSLRGYGPSKALYFTGQAEDFELWSIKFKGYLRINKLHKTLEQATPGDEDANAEIFALMVQFLDDKSLNLIIRDATDNGREAYKILSEHYLGTSKPRIRGVSWFRFWGGPNVFCLSCFFLPFGYIMG